ncbi:MAG TPA: AraC family transcriptional regulator [Kofleriaceae bacterium]|nr:AraC family transcriptional regulator [Kofleriaceae bacterium]
MFTALQIRSALYCRMEANAPWGAAFAGSPHAKFGLVARGSCWLEVAGEPRAIPLRGGDCYIAAPGIAITVRDALRTRAVDGELLLRSKVGELLTLGGDGPATHVVTGLFEFDEWSRTPLSAMLPRVLVISADEAQASSLAATLQLLASETASRGIGSAVVVRRLAEIMFVQMVRAYHASGRAREVGWVAALGDPQLGSALRALHQAPAEPWSVARLARAAGMSRSAFAARFKAQLGETPLDYLTRWRMYKAGTLLREGVLGIAEIASAVGYDSPGAFHRAFRRVHDQPPGAFRRATARVPRDHPRSTE